MFHIRKNISLLLAVLCIAVMFAGCKIELPAQVSSQTQSELSSAAENSASLSQPESEVSSAANSSASSSKAASAVSKTASSKQASSMPISSKPAARTAVPKASSSSAPAENKPLTCTLMISCETLLNHMNQLNKAEKSIIPASGILYQKQIIEFRDGETVFDVLKHERDAGHLRFEYQETPAYNSVYLTSIDGLGRTLSTSGWTYRVNTTFIPAGCSAVKLHNGDIIEWHYTCNTGRDLNNLPAPGTMG